MSPHIHHTYRIFSLLILLFLLAQVGPVKQALGMPAPDREPGARVTGQVRPAALAPTQEPAPASPPARPVVARISFKDQADLNRLAASLDIWEVQHEENLFLAQVTPQEWETLATAGYRLEIDGAKTRLLEGIFQPVPGQEGGIPGFECYRTVEETYAALADLAVQYPGLAERIDIGDSWDKTQPGGPVGYDLFALRLTNESRPGPKPVFFLMAEIHARELTTAELALRFAEMLAANYQVDPDVTWLLDYYEVQIVPMSNPDGRKLAETGRAWRKNTDSDDGCSFPGSWGTDLNRNHSFRWGGAGMYACGETYQGPSPASEPETQAIQGYVASLFPDQRGPGDQDPAPAGAAGVFLTLHSYSRLVLYPWGWTNTPPPNLAALRTLGRKFGYFNAYEVCQSGESGCIYATTGTSDDWAYGELGVASYTFEMGTSFFQSCSEFENTILPQNLPALLYALKAARQPYLDPSGPETLSSRVSPAAIVAGDSIILAATADDTRFDSNGWGMEPSQPVAAARYSIDAPSWIGGAPLRPLSPEDGAFDSAVESLRASLQPGCLSAGRHTIFIESQDSAGNWGVPGSVFLQVEPRIGLNPVHAGGYAHPGQALTYTIQVTNRGSTADSFAVTTIGQHWTTAAPTVLGPLPPGAATSLIVTVTVPPGANPGDSDTVILTLASQGIPCHSVELKISTYVPKTAVFLPFAFK